MDNYQHVNIAGETPFSTSAVLAPLVARLGTQIILFQKQIISATEMNLIPILVLFNS
jgi:hypothetical protein